MLDIIGNSSFLTAFLSIVGMIAAVALAISLHECAHGVVALWNGDYTAKANGRLSLNPLKHFDLIGFIMLITVRFGFAKPVPVNPNNFKKLKRGIFTVAIAGIVTNLVTAFIAAPFAMLLLKAMSVTEGALYYFIMPFQAFFQQLVFISVALAFFNLLPFYPLDGFRILESFTKFTNKFTKFFRDYGKYIMILLVGIHIITRAAGLVSVHIAFKYIDLIGLYMDVVAGNTAMAFLNIWGFVL